MSKLTLSYLASLTDRIDNPSWHADPSSRSERSILEVFTGDELVAVPIGTEEDVAEAFKTARIVQREWEKTALSRRAHVLSRFADLVWTNRAQLMDVVQAESGKNRASAQEEVLDVILNARFYAKNGPGWLDDRRVKGVIPGFTKTRVIYQPVGIVGVVTPWNYPLSLGVSDSLAALMSGNGIVQKPDSQTPLSALAVGRLMDEAGLPEGLWQIVTGAGREVGNAIAETANYLMFTGSSATGSKLGEITGRRLIGFSAELGGKNPMIVTADADLKNAAQVAVRACFSSGGQLCISMERIYVEESAYDQFLKLFKAETEAMRIGPSYKFNTEMGALISANHRKKIASHVDDAVAKGAKIVTGGRSRDDLGGTFYEPTVLVDVPETAMLYREETFGPVVSVYRAASVDDAIEQANDTEYGLNSCVCAGSDADALEIARQLHTGMCNINEGYAAAWGSLDGPSGGIGVSGMSYRHGVEGLRKYTHARTIATQSKLLNFGPPARAVRDVWPHALGAATNLMKYLPGR